MQYRRPGGAPPCINAHLGGASQLNAQSEEAGRDRNNEASIRSPFMQGAAIHMRPVRVHLLRRLLNSRGRCVRTGRKIRFLQNLLDLLKRAKICSLNAVPLCVVMLAIRRVCLSEKLLHNTHRWRFHTTLREQ